MGTLVGNGIPFLSCKGDPPKNDNRKVTLGLARFDQQKKQKNPPETLTEQILDFLTSVQLEVPNS